MNIAAGRRIWDVIVLGGGPAGAVAAYTMARAGLDTLLVERSRFPRFKVCGGYISARAVEQLRSLGLGPRIAALGGTPLSAVRIGNGRGPAVDLPLPGGFSVRRATFDAALVEAARDVGVSVRFGTPARLIGPVSENAGTRRVLTKRAGETEQAAEARVVVAADGLGHSSLAGLSEFQSIVARNSRIGVGSVLPDGGPSYRTGTIYMAVGRAGYVGLVKIEGGPLNVAAALDPDVVRQDGGVRDVLTSILNDADFRIPQGLGSTHWYGTPRMTRRSSRTASHRVLLVGDCAAYLEPFTGEGISWAVSDAMSVGRYVERGIGTWTRDLENEWMSRHDRRIVGEGKLSRLVSALLRSGPVVTLGLRAVRQFPVLAEPAVELACRRAGGGPR